MKKSVKIITTLLMIVMLVSVVTPCFASSAIVNIPNGTVTPDATLLQKVGNIIGYLKWIAAIAAVIIVTILGIKYMLGSVEEKAEYKKSFVPLIVGIAVVVLATQIASIIFKTFE